MSSSGNDNIHENSQPIDLTAEDIALNLDDAHYLLKLADKLGASDAEVFMIKAAGTDFSIEKDVVKFASSSTEFGIGIRVIKEKCTGFGYCTSVDHAEQAVKNALSITKLQKATEFEFIPKQQYNKIPSIFDDSIINLTVTDGLAGINQLITASKEVNDQISVTGGGIGYGGGTVALVTSAGVELEYRATGIFGGVSTLLRDKTVSTGFEFASSRKNDLNYSEIGRIAAELAINGQNPQPVEPGNYPVIFTPEAIAELIESTIIPGLYGEQAMKGETFYSNKIGTSVAPNQISFIDSGILENGINTAPWDDEGTPSQETILMENGVLKRYLYDRNSAVEFNESSTGNGMRTEGYNSNRSYRAIPKTKGSNFLVTSKDKCIPKEDLICEQKNGLIIHELLGAHTANPASGDFAVNSPMLFKIKDGSIEAAAKQVMISGNMAQLIKQIIALGDDFKTVSGGLSPVAFRIPSIAIDKVKII